MLGYERASAKEISLWCGFRDRAQRFPRQWNWRHTCEWAITPWNKMEFELLSGPLAAAAGRQRWGHGHAVTTKFRVSEDSDNQIHIPSKFVFSSDFCHLIMVMLKIRILIHVLFTWIVQFSFRSFVDSVCIGLLMCIFALQCRYYVRSGAGNIASHQTYLFDVII